MPRTTNYREFFEIEQPDSAEELADLAACVSGPNELGRYKSYPDNVQSLVIAGDGDLELVLSSEGSRNAFIEFLRLGLSEEGASFEGDAAFERAMKKD